MKKSSRRSSILPKDGASTVGSFSTRFSLPSFVKRVNKLTEAQKEAIKKTGFGSLLLIPNQMLCKNLLVELMERWNCDKSAFVFPHGEITISPMDIAVILGLRVKGDAVIIGEDSTFLSLEKDYGAALWNRKITVSSVEERLESLGEIGNDDFVRSFLLYMFGTLLFPNTNGKIDSRYLHFLCDVDKVDQFAWGSAVLDDVFHWLTRRKKDNVQYVGGCLIFLQVWCYEHIDIARPFLNDEAVKFPRVCRWVVTRSHKRQWYIEKFATLEKFKTLVGHQIIWSLELTPEELEIGIIKELLEAQSENAGQITKQQSSTDVCNMEQLTDDIEVDIVTSDLTSATCCVETETVPSECPLNTCGDSAVLISSNDDCEDDLKRKNLILEEKITKLRKENDDLTREVENLRKENQVLSSATDSLVVHLERIVLDGNTDTVDDEGINEYRVTAERVD